MYTIEIIKQDLEKIKKFAKTQRFDFRSTWLWNASDVLLSFYKLSKTMDNKNKFNNEILSFINEEVEYLEYK
jgi:hypothetical protein